MQKNNKNEDFLNAILGAAIMASAAEQAKKPEGETEKDENMDRAQHLREQYDAFLAVGFTEEQATAFIAALLH